MTKLKTLKDIHTFLTERRPHGISPDAHHLVDSIRVEDLKQEVIKWIKERITKCKECSCLGSWSQLLACKEHKFWMIRFNITDKDLNK